MPIDPNCPYRGAAYYYAQYRYRISSVFTRLIAARLVLTPQDRILDLGCGPGMLTERFAPYVREVVAADPEPDMLDEGRRRCTAAGLANVSFVQASSRRLATLSQLPVHDDDDRFRAVLIGQAFHWMRPQDATLQLLSPLTADTGAVVLVSPEVRTYRPGWWNDVEAIIRRYLAGAPDGEHPGGRLAEYAGLLRRSSFCEVEELRLEYDVEEQPNLESALGLWYSVSWVLERLGDRRAALEEEARAQLGWIDELPPRRVRRRDVALFGMRTAA